MAQAPNLTRDQAKERSAIVRGPSYEIDIDLTDGAGGNSEKTFDTKAVVRFGAGPGASTVIDFVGDAHGPRPAACRCRDCPSPTS